MTRCRVGKYAALARPVGDVDSTALIKSTTCPGSPSGSRRTVESGVLREAPVLVGVMPPRSTAALAHMHGNIPGVEVDDATFVRLAGLAGDDAIR